MIRAAPFLLAVAAFVVACGGDGVPGEAATDVAAATSEVIRGPVTLRVRFEPKEARLSDEPTLTISASAPEDIEVELPPFGDNVGSFLVRGYSTPLPDVAGGVRTTRQIYRLEPTVAGKQTLTGVSIRFRQGENANWRTIEADPVHVVVRTLHGDEVPRLAALKPAAGPVALPEPPSEPVWPWIAGMVALFVLAGAWLLHRLRRRGDHAPIELTPQQRAEREFAALLRDDPLARGELQTFYVELTGIVRRYIERTVGLRAPERTTDEFLRDMRGHPAFPQDRQERLRAFLESADLVKFAAMSPAPDEIDAAVARAKAFVGIGIAPAPVGDAAGVVE
ncbi:MAG: hypothetical protein V3T86_15870 [Planctomycetota bacterium]